MEIENVRSLTDILASPFYNCPNCSRVYSSQGNLRRHLTFECGKKPSFYCPHCEYKGYRKYHLQRHIFNKHLINIF